MVLCVWVLISSGWCCCGGCRTFLRWHLTEGSESLEVGLETFYPNPTSSALCVTGCPTLVPPHSLPRCAVVSQTVTRISPIPFSCFYWVFSTAVRSRADSECQQLAEGNHPLSTCLRSKLFHYDICWSQWASRVNANFLSSHHRSFDGVDSPWRSLLRIQFLC